MSFEMFVERINGFVWGWGTMILILGVGLALTVRTRCVQVRRLGTALRCAVCGEEGGKGEVSPFGALCTALAATIGTGNIVGVATAIAGGGPGALFWMIAAAFLGMATKYAEGLLAVRYRRETRPGHFLGGPFCYIEGGLGQKWKWLARLFAFFGAAAGIMGIGTVVQINGITSAASALIDPQSAAVAFSFGGRPVTWTTVIVGTAATVLAGLVIFGGVRRIARVSAVVVPVMAGGYVLFAMMILIVNFSEIPAALGLIVSSAFRPEAAGGALSGLLVRDVIRKGIGRGIFSNEAGLGSAAIAAASAKTNEPVRQGLAAMVGTFIDTIVICTMTGLSIVITGAWDPRVTGAKLEGVEVTAYAWRSGLPFDEGFSAVTLTVCLCFFAFTTILGWNHYGERCLEYLCGGRRGFVTGYRVLYILSVLAGPYLTVSAAWNLADVFNGMMAFPNLIALFLLAGVVGRETRAYFERERRDGRR